MVKRSRVVSFLMVSMVLLVSTMDADAQDPEEAAAPKKFLLVGDSMAWGLGLALKPMMEAEGRSFRFRHKTSDSIRAYAANARMRDDLRKYEPDVVLITLGSNEALIPKPEALVKPVKKIVRHVGDKPCYWIGPPMWRDDTGVVKVLEEHVAPCRFFNSSALEIERRKDGYHPNKQGSETWARAVLAWISENPPAKESGDE